MKKHLIMGAALAVLAAASAASAGDTVIDASGDVNNVQKDVGHEVSTVTGAVADINGNVSQTAAAIGNSFSVSGTGSDGGIDPKSTAGVITNSQETTKGISASIGKIVGKTSTPVTVTNIVGNVSQTAAAIGNSASVSVGSIKEFDNYQGTQNQDPAALVDSTISNVTGNVNVTAAALGNSLSVTTPDAAGSIGTINNNDQGVDGYGQVNQAPINAAVDNTITNVSGDVTATSAAIGNSFSATANTIGTIDNTQTNTGPITSRVDTSVGALNEAVFGDVSLTAAAIGNSFSATTPDSNGTIGDINNNSAGNDGTGQVNTGTIKAKLDTAVQDITGKVSETAAAIGNSFSATADSLGNITSTQTNAGRVSAKAEGSVSEINWKNVTGDTVAITAAAIGNSLSFAGNTTSAGGIDNTQTNTGKITAKVTADVGATNASVTADVTQTAAAIGNSYSASNTGSDGGTDLQSTANVMTNVQSSTGTVTANLGTWATPVTDTYVTGNVAGTAAAIGNSATDNFGTIANINNDQSNTGAITALVNENVNNVTGTTTLTSAAIGNSLSATGPNGIGNFSNVLNGGADPGQTNSGDITANVNTNINTVNGSVSETAAAIGNSVSLTTEDMGTFANGQSNTGDVSSKVNTYIYDVNPNSVTDETVSLTAAAIGNSLSFTGTNGGAGALTSSQTNSGWITASVNATVGQTGGAVNAAVTTTAAAIGNSYSITVK